jgi:lipopolysaccharide assembly outer membrane protein LptD (OstA)
LQVSKISSSYLFVLLLLFQQFDVGLEAKGSTISVINEPGQDIFITPDTTAKITSEAIIVDTIVPDTNIIKDDALKFPVKYHARDSIRVNIIDEVVYLFGAATVDYDDMHLQSDYIVIDMNKKELYAEGIKDSTGVLSGTPEFSQADQKFRSNSIRYNLKQKRAKFLM